MAEGFILQRIADLAAAGYLPSVGAWVQIAPPITTILTAFNTLGRQSIELWTLDPEGNSTAPPRQLTLETGRALRLDLAEMVPVDRRPFEGSVWVWAKGDTAEGSLGLQATGLEFVDLSRPAGHLLGGVHLIYDFFNTAGIPPYLDLVSPRVLVAEPGRYNNYLGLAHVLVSSNLTGPVLRLRLANEQGDVLEAPALVTVPLLGSRYLMLEALFPDMASFLRPSGQTRGYGTLSVLEASGQPVGLTAMLKVVDNEAEELLVDHLVDRSFARPAQKDPT